MVKSPESIVLCPGCNGWGKVTDKRYVEREGSHGRTSTEAEFYERTCERCNGHGRVMQWVEDRPLAPSDEK